jgi:hypothetical protein
METTRNYPCLFFINHISQKHLWNQSSISDWHSSFSIIKVGETEAVSKLGRNFAARNLLEGNQFHDGKVD